MALPGDPPGTLYYWLPINCPDCGQDGWVVERDPTPFPVMRRACGNCGKHHLNDRDPDPEDEYWYRFSKPAEQIVALTMAAHKRDRTVRQLKPKGRGFRFVIAKRGDN